MTLTHVSYVVLGMLNIGARSGYEIKAAVDRSARFFWTISPVQIYPELKRLEEGGLIASRDASRGGRARRTYRLKAAGKRALADWLSSPEELTMEWRDSGLLRLFFADAVGPDQAVEHVRAIRDRSEQLANQFRSDVCPAAEQAREEHGQEFPLIAARFGLDFHEWVAQWCGELEDELLMADPAPAR